MARGTFWKVCAGWAVILAIVAAARGLSVDEPSPQAEYEPSMPPVGDQLQLPSTLTTRQGTVIPPLGPRGTFFLVTWTGCPRCRREVTTYATLLRDAAEAGFATRMLVVPSSSAEDEWFLARVPSDAPVVLDPSKEILSALRVTVTPSAIVLDSHGIVEAVFSPSGEWPVTVEQLAPVAIDRSSTMNPRTGGGSPMTQILMTRGEYVLRGIVLGVLVAFSAAALSPDVALAGGGGSAPPQCEGEGSKTACDCLDKDFDGKYCGPCPDGQGDCYFHECYDDGGLSCRNIMGDCGTVIVPEWVDQCGVD